MFRPSLPQNFYRNHRKKILRLKRKFSAAEENFESMEEKFRKHGRKKLSELKKKNLLE